MSPILLGLSIAIMIDDPGPVLFTQKRVGQNKRYFKLHKFRSMKMNTPHEILSVANEYFEKNTSFS